jgi:hypothetical protein
MKIRPVRSPVKHILASPTQRDFVNYRDR